MNENPLVVSSDGRKSSAGAAINAACKAIAPQTDVSTETRLIGKRGAVAGNQVLSLAFTLVSVFFGLGLVAVSTTVADYNVPILVRGSGMVQFSGGMVLLTPALDKVLLIVVSAALLAIFWVSAFPRLRSVAGGSPLLLTLSTTMLLSLGLEAATLKWYFVPLVGAAGVAVVGYGIRYGPRIFRESSRKMLFRLLFAATALTTAIEATSAASWLLDGFDGAPPLSGGSWYVSLLELRLFDLAYWLLPRLTLLFFFAWMIRLVSGAYLAEFRRALSFKLTEGAEDRSASGPAPAWAGNALSTLGGSVRFALLGLAVGLGVFVGVYAYLPAVNPTATLVGTDVSGFYGHALSQMLALPPSGSIYYAFSNDRSVYLLFQYALAGLVRSPDLALRAMPAVLAALLVLSTYSFVSVAGRDRTLAATAALFAAFSFQVTVGVNGGFYPNWLAVAESFGFFAAFVLGLQTRSRRYVVISGALSILVLYTHPWEWFVLVGVVAAYEGIAVLQEKLRDGRIERFEILFVVGLLVVNFAADQVKQFLPTGSGIASVYSSTLVNLSLSNFVQVVNTLETTFQVFLGGAFANPAMIILSIVGVLAIPSLHRRFGRLLICWLMVTSAGILFSGYSAEFLQSRVLYLVPFQVFAAMGFLVLVRFVTSFVARRTAPGIAGRVFTVLAYVASSAMFLSYALRTVGYLYV